MSGSTATSTEINAEVNRLFDALSHYKTSVIPLLDGVMAGFALVAPVTVEQINALPVRDRARLWKHMLTAGVSLAAEIGERKHEDMLAELGYASIAAVIEDAPNHLSGQDLATAVNTLTRVGALLVLVDGLLDSAAVADITNRVCEAKAATADVADNIRPILKAAAV